jgi:hypothetical protein
MAVVKMDEVIAMNQPLDWDRPRSESEKLPTGNKKPYRKPALRHERVFETQALSCGKVQTTQGPCHYNRKTS